MKRYTLSCLFFCGAVLHLFSTAVLSTPGKQTDDNFANAPDPSGSNDSAEIITDQSRDSLAMKVASQYSTWKILTLRCSQLGDKAVAAGITAAPDDLQERLAAYTSAFPNVRLDTFTIKKEVILQKFIQESLGIVPAPSEIQGCYDDYLENSPLSAPPPESGIRPILYSRAILSKDTIHRICNDLSEQNRQKIMQQEIQRLEPWAQEEISLHGDSHQCIVRDPKTSQCCISVDEFNSYCFLHPVPKWIRLDKAREQALRAFLSTRYFADQAIDAGIPGEQKRLQTELPAVERKILLKKYPWLMQPIRDDALLAATYDKYYRFFCDKKIKTVALIGSSDSGYIDSLYRVLQSFDHSTVPESALKKQSFIKLLPWITASTDDLPDSIVSAVDTLRIQQVRNLKTPFGFFICRIIENKRRRAIPLKNVTLQLSYLITEERKASKGESDTIRAMHFYKNHSKMFVSPDTILCRTWLIPFIDTTAIAALPEINRSSRIAKDTTMFLSQHIWSTDLPSAVGDSLRFRLKSYRDSVHFIGPIDSRFGKWYFSVLKIIPGGKKIPFARVKCDICKSFEIQCLPFDSIRETEMGKHLISMEALAGAYRHKVNDELKDIPDEEVKKQMEIGLVKAAASNKSLSDDDQIEDARNLIKEKRNKDDSTNMMNWIESLIIDRAVLFAGCESAPEKTDR